MLCDDYGNCFGLVVVLVDVIVVLYSTYLYEYYYKEKKMKNIYL